jgi:hypothetical protein
MSATRQEREQHAKPDRSVDTPQRPYWKRMHHSWFFWVAAVSILVAMVIYITSIDLAFRPQGAAPGPAAKAP